MPITAGTRLGSYEIVAQIGAGGMGEVYRARDTKLKRDVAVKVLTQEFARDAGHVLRFNREAELLASLNHPNLAAIYSVGEYEGQPFIVMELLEGQTLKATIDSGRIPYPKVLDLAIQISDALQSAHVRGVVHRDIKPANIHITPAGQTKILDFGIAKLVAESHAEAVSTSAPTAAGRELLTEAGTAIGTVAYMSPEQVRGEELDARTDLFSFGLVLYEMATGRQAFSGSTSGVILEAILNRAPIAPVQLNPSVPQGLDRIIYRLLEKDRRFRYQSSADLHSDLERLKRELSDTGFKAAAVAEKKSIVVLPFSDISATRDNAYFADGLTDEIITDLSQIQNLRVISRNSSMQLKGSNRDLKSIAQELKIQYVLEGTVRTAGESLRVTAQLIDALTDEHLWADKYSGKLEDVFDIQEQISRKIVDALKMKLSSQEERKLSERSVSDIHAFEYYHRARHELYKFTEEGLDNALQLIESGLSISGDNELLYAAKGTVYWQYVNAAIRSDEAYFDKAEECARQIYRLNPNSASGHQVLGLVLYHRGRRGEAVRMLKRALAIEPNNVFVLGELCRMYFVAGKMTEARAVDAQMQALDPLAPIAHIETLALEVLEEISERGLEVALQYQRMIPEFAFHRLICVLGLIQRGRLQEALTLAEAAPGEKVPTIAGRQCAFLKYALSGNHADALTAVSETLKAAARRVEWWSLVMADCYALIDKKDEAMDWLSNAIDRGFTNYPFLAKYDKTLARFHGDARFDELIKKAKYELDRFDV
ncbi:MAG TPA: FlgO family outer membrane protein [Terriglobia bacterium]|nr:FlgO family outer membrane protein [Terriglobia bacterium]